MPSRLSSPEIRRLADLYDLERYLFQQVSQRFEEEQTLTSYDFFAIIVWKSNRAKTKVRRGLSAAHTSVQTLMQQVAEAPRPVDKVSLLAEIDGIGIRMASAILAVCYPSEFTVLDYRAWETLCNWELEGLPRTVPRTPASYVQYCEACARFAAREGISVRDLDRALWARSWENDLNELIEGMET
jgi:hypothetical protein